MPEVEETVETTETTEVEQPQTPTGETPEQKAERISKELESAKSHIHKLNKENEKRRKDQEEADRKAAEEQGKFKELYETEQGKVTQLTTDHETAKEKLAKYETILSADIEARIKDWPEAVKKLIPLGEGVDALSRFESVTNHAELAQKLMDKPVNPGNGPGPRASGGPAGKQEKEASQQQAGFIKRQY